MDAKCLRPAYVTNGLGRWKNVDYIIICCGCSLRELYVSRHFVGIIVGKLMGSLKENIMTGGEPDIYGTTEAHLIDRELNKEIIMIHGPPPPYYYIAHWGGDVNLSWDDNIELDTSEPIIKIQYKLCSKKCFMDGMVWVAEYKQCF